MSDSNYWEGCESGPFCAHWHELGDDLENICVCGHSCNEHLGGFDNEPCTSSGCECRAFEEVGETVAAKEKEKVEK